MIEIKPDDRASLTVTVKKISQAGRNGDKFNWEAVVNLNGETVLRDSYSTSEVEDIFPQVQDRVGQQIDLTKIRTVYESARVQRASIDPTTGKGEGEYILTQFQMDEILDAHFSFVESQKNRQFGQRQLV